jgi:shikimate kinase
MLAGPTFHHALRAKTIVLVGLMGVGKTSIGRRLAAALEVPFRDADAEIEAAAARPITDIFTDLGEEAFRDGERRVIARLLTREPPHVLATGGGAFLRPETRSLIQEKALSVWLKTDLEILARRVSRKDTRPLLRGRDPLQVLQEQAEVRYPAYAQAAVTVDTGNASHMAAVAAVLEALSAYMEGG